MEIWFNISQALLYGYIYIIPLLLISYWVLKKHRPAIKEVIICSNILSLFALTLKVYLSLSQLKQIFHPSDDQSAYFFKQRIFGPYGFAYWIPLITNLIVLFLLLFKKCRNSIWISILVIITYFPYLFENLIVWITSYYRDYLPSSWSVYNPFKFVIVPPLGYVLLLLITDLMRRQFRSKGIDESTNLQQ